jgi:OOP family OmpA-OmpF porin
MKKIVLASALAALMGSASAQVYVGGSFGFSQIEVDCTGADTCDKSDSSFKLYGGYQLNPTVALELGYIDFGKSAVSGYSYYGYTTGDLSFTAVTINAALRAPFSPVLNGVLRLGVANVSTEAKGRVGIYAGSDSESATKPYLGLGLEYAFNKRLRGTLGADFTQGEIYGDSGSIRAFTLGVQYGF